MFRGIILRRVLSAIGRLRAAVNALHMLYRGIWINMNCSGIMITGVENVQLQYMRLPFKKDNMICPGCGILFSSMVVDRNEYEDKADEIEV